MADDSLLTQLMRAAEDDRTVYQCLAQHYQGTPLHEALAGCVLILSAQLKAANQALADHLAHCPHPRRPEH